MEKVKIYLKDKRILDVLDRNSNATLSEIAKKVLLTKQGVEYRLKKLLSQKTIYAFFTLIDPGKLGYSLFRVHIKIKNISEEKYSNFARQLFNKYQTFWVAFVSGSFDIIADIWAHNANDFQKLFAEILKKHGDTIYSYEIFPLLELNMYNYGYFLNKNSSRKKTTLFHNEKNLELNEKDKKILEAMKTNSRISYEEIGRKAGLTRNAVKYRIENLEKSKVIAGYQMMIHFRHFGRLSYKVFIKYNPSKFDQEQSLLDAVKEKASILAHTKLLGKWNLDIEIQPSDAKELQKFIIELRSKFSLIEDYELIQIIDDYGIDFFPNLPKRK